MKRMLRLFAWIFIICGILFGAFGIGALDDQGANAEAQNNDVLFLFSAAVLLLAGAFMLARVRVAGRDPLVKKEQPAEVGGPDQPASEGARP